ncbi:MAG: PilZ domain-containing protein [Planctomycetales bacterium]|nr:PilZ domain-containing protein [Planctomycetales bacterium]
MVHTALRTLPRDRYNPALPTPSQEAMQAITNSISTHFQRILNHFSRDSDNQRSAKRSLYSQPITCTKVEEVPQSNHKGFTARGRDLSHTGIRLIHSEPLHLGERITMSFTATDGSRVTMLGCVRWCKQDQYSERSESGVEFIAANG